MLKKLLTTAGVAAVLAGFYPFRHMPTSNDPIRLGFLTIRSGFSPAAGGKQMEDGFEALSR